MSTKQSSVRINHHIRASEVRLISAKGEQLGVMTVERALQLAQKENKDLIEVSPNAKPPVCKIIDYGKFLYQQAKRDKENKKIQHVVKLKEVKIKPNIGDHDLEIKIKRAKEFLEKGNKVRFTCMFRGREIAHASLGEKLMNQVIEELEEYAQVDASPKLIGRNMQLILAPISKKKGDKNAKNET